MAVVQGNVQPWPCAGSLSRWSWDQIFAHVLQEEAVAQKSFLSHPTALVGVTTTHLIPRLVMAQCWGEVAAAKAHCLCCALNEVPLKENSLWMIGFPCWKACC